MLRLLPTNIATIKQPFILLIPHYFLLSCIFAAGNWYFTVCESILSVRPYCIRPQSMLAFIFMNVNLKGASLRYKNEPSSGVSSCTLPPKGKTTRGYLIVPNPFHRRILFSLL
jgi:hypothetical protein